MAVQIGGGNGGALAFAATLDLNPYKAESDKLTRLIQNQSNQITNAANQQAAQMEGLAKKASAAIGAYLSFGAAKSFVTDIIRVRGEFQQLETSLTTFLGSKEKADKLMSEAVKLAAVTPFTLQEVGSGTKQLLAYGFAAGEVTKNLEMIGNIAAGVGAPLNDIVYTYGTLRAQGRAYAQDIRQFTGRGIPIIAELAKQFHTTSEEVDKLVSEGKVGFPQIEKAFQSMTSSGGMFFNLMQEQSKTLTGQLSNLEDAWSRMLNEIGKSNEGVFNSAISGAISLVENYKTLIDALKLIVIAYGAYRAALLLTIVQERYQQAAALQSALAGGVLTKSMQLQAVTARVLSGAYRALASAAPVAAIAAVATVLYGLTQTVNAAAESEANLQEIQTSGIKASIEERNKIEDLVKVLKDKSATHDEQADALKKLREQSGDYLKAFTDEQILAGQATGALDLYIQSVEKLGLAKAATAKKSLLQGDLVDLEVKGIKAIDTFEKLGSSIKALFGAGDYKKVGYFDQLLFADKSDDAIVSKKKADIKKQIDDINAFIKKETGEALKNNPGGSSSTTIAQARSLKVIEDEIAALKEKQTLESTSQKQFLVFQEQINKLEAEATAIRGASQKQLKAENSSLEQRKKILEDIASMQRESKQSGLLKEQSEIDKVNERYEALFKTISDFNKANPKNKIGQSALNDLAKAQQEQVSNLNGIDQAEKYQQTIEKQKGYFDDFQKYQQQQLGDKAEEVYQSQLQGFKSYIDLLKAELAKLDGKTDIGSEKSRIFLSKAILDEESRKRDAALKKEVDDYKELITMTETYNGKRAAIDSKYNDLNVVLEKNRTKIIVSEYDTRLKALQEAKKSELESIALNEVQKADAYKKFAKDLGNVGFTATKGIKKGLDELKVKFKDNAEALALVEEAAQKVMIALNEQSVKGIRDAATFLRSAFKDMNIQVAGQLKITTSQITEALDNVATLMDAKSNKGQQVGSIIGLISFVIVGIRDALLTAKDLADPLQAQKDYYSQISNEIAASNELLLRQKNILEDLSGLQKVQLSANYLDDLKSKQDQALKSLQEFRLNVIKSSKEVYVDPVFGTEVSTGGLNALADIFLYGGQAKRKMKLDLQIVDTSQLSTIEEYAKLLNEIKAGGGKLNGKTVVEDDIKSLQLLIDTYDETVAQQKEFKLQFEQLLTGTTANSITDSIVDGFRNGLRSAKDFADNFQELMKNAVFQSLKIQALEGPLKVFYEEFAKSTASDDVLTEDEIRQLKDNFNGIISEAGKKFDQLQQITKLDLSSNSASAQANSLKGQIKGITEDQAQLLAGQFGGLRLTALDHLNISKSSLQVLNAIQSHTAYLVTHLPSVDRSLTDMKMNGIKIR